MILVTGASGKTGKNIIRQLAAHQQPVRAWIRRPENAQAMLAAGAVETFVGDMLDPHSASKAVQGIEKIYHICPNVNPKEFEIGQWVIDAAQSAGVQHFVYHSVLHPQIEAMPHHWLKMRVEEYLFKSGLPFTILQPSAYMQNILSGWKDICTAGIHRVPYAAQTRISLVDLEDLAKAAAQVLVHPEHRYGIYEICGPQAPSQLEIAETLSAVLQRPVRVEVQNRNQWASAARSNGLGEFEIETLLKMFSYYEDFDFVGNHQTLNHLIGKSTSFEQFVKRIPVFMA